MINMALTTDGSDQDWPQVAPAEYWENRYAESDRMWSGRVNTVLADVAASLPAGSALDLGCGEGADVIWLAKHGWRATGIDISSTAIARATEAARAAGLSTDQAKFLAADLSALTPDAQQYDLVSASFLHSPVELSRTEVLRRASDMVAPNGYLLITSHAAAPPWADASAHHHTFLGPEEELAALALNPSHWQTVAAEVRPREATAPDGTQAHLEDTVLLLQNSRSEK